MAIEVLDEPSKSLSTVICKWNCVHQPIRYKLRRRDFSVTSFSDSGGGVVKVSIADTSEITSGEAVYISINGVADDQYSGMYVATGLTSTTFNISITFPFASISSMAFVNLIIQRKNYYIKTNIIATDTVTILGTSINRPNGLQVLYVSIESFLKPYIDFKNTFSYNTINDTDATLGGSYYKLDYLEYYNGEYQSTKSSSKTWGFANAVKQIQEKYGYNLLDYYTNNLDKTPPKFMVDFIKPTYFVGFPFSLTYLHGDDYTRIQKNIGLNGNVISTVPTLLNSRQNVNRLMLGALPAGTKSVSIFLENGSASIDTERKTVKINDSCQQNPVYLCWLGKKGGMNYWCFNKTQTIAKQVANTTEFVPNVFDIETALGYAEFYNKDSIPQMIIGATVDTEDVQGISTMLDSVSVLMLTNPLTWLTDGPGSPATPLPKWMRVKVQAGSFKLYETENKKTTVEFIMDLPQLYNQNQ